MTTLRGQTPQSSLLINRGVLLMIKLPLVYRFALHVFSKSLLLIVLVGGMLFFFRDFSFKGAMKYLWSYKGTILTITFISAIISHSYELPIPKVPYSTYLSSGLFVFCFPLIGEGFIPPWQRNDRLTWYFLRNTVWVQS